jgi:hypothetical protein
MKYIKKLNIDFDNWEKINNNFFNEKYVLIQLNQEEKNKYLLFINFLLQNNIFDKFFVNFFNKKTTFYWDNFYKNEEDKIIDLISETPFNTLIPLSFNWNKTNEGFEFWNDIFKKWLILMNKIK